MAAAPSKERQAAQDWQSSAMGQMLMHLLKSCSLQSLFRSVLRWMCIILKISYKVSEIIHKGRIRLCVYNSRKKERKNNCIH